MLSGSGFALMVRNPMMDKPVKEVAGASRKSCAKIRPMKGLRRNNCCFGYYCWYSNYLSPQACQRADRGTENQRLRRGG